MGCPSPLTITRDLSTFRDDNPHKPKPGDLGVYTDRRTGKYRVEMSVPCGKCNSCFAARASQWAVRCYCESLEHDRSSFLTLTYADTTLPSDGRLVKKDLQDFFKRLRKKVPTVRYFACGEYGDNTRRPHYHALLFGSDFLGGSSPFVEGHFTNPVLDKIWGKGFVTIAPLSYSTICYTVGYVAKKIGDPDCFQIMSRRPGLGAKYVQKFEDDIRRTGAITIEGREYPLPEYFFTQEDFDDIKQARKADAQKIHKTAQTLHSRRLNAAEKTNRKKGLH